MAAALGLEWIGLGLDTAAIRFGVGGIYLVYLSPPPPRERKKEIVSGSAMESVVPTNPNLRGFSAAAGQGGAGEGRGGEETAETLRRAHACRATARGR